MADGVSWRRLDGSLIGRMDASKVPYDRRLHGLPLGKLLALTREHLDRRPNAKIHYLHKVTRLEQGQDKAKVYVDTPEGEKVFEADYIVGCDGANSTVRRALFGDEFPGYTWPEQIVATNVSFFAFSSVLISSLRPACVCVMCMCYAVRSSSVSYDDFLSFQL